MVGYFAYDIVNSLFFQVKNNRKKPAGETPDARFMLTKDCIVFDHRDRRLFIFSSPFLTYDTDPAAEYQRCAAHIGVLVKQIATIAEKPPSSPISPMVNPQKPLEISDNTDREEFTRAVETIKEHIVTGDIFQAVLSRRMECDVGADPFPIYAALRAINPSPYMLPPRFWGRAGHRCKPRDACTGWRNGA